MYGFGDDRNPANDTVNMMEEILIEYISDVVSILLSELFIYLINVYWTAVHGGDRWP